MSKKCKENRYAKQSAFSKRSKKFVVEDGIFYLSSLSSGDKFKDDSIVIYDVIPGETYSIDFFEYN